MPEVSEPRTCITCRQPKLLDEFYRSKDGKHVFENLQILSGRENITKGAIHPAWTGGHDARGI